jgi:hypothetical protein
MFYCSAVPKRTAACNNGVIPDGRWLSIHEIFLALFLLRGLHLAETEQSQMAAIKEIFLVVLLSLQPTTTELSYSWLPIQGKKVDRSLKCKILAL